jgi:hypothetical protein
MPDLLINGGGSGGNGSIDGLLGLQVLKWWELRWSHYQGTTDINSEDSKDKE